MVLQTVVGIGGSSLLDGGQMESVVPNRLLTQEEVQPLTDRTDAARKHSHRSQLPQVKLVLAEKNDLASTKLLSSGAPFFDEDELKTDDSRFTRGKICLPCSIFGESALDYYEVIENFGVGNIDGFIERKHVVKALKFFDEDGRLMSKTHFRA